MTNDWQNYFHHSMTSNGLLKWSYYCVAAWSHGHMIHKVWTAIKHKKILLYIMKITTHNYKNTSPNCENTTWIWIEYYYGIIKRYYTIYSMHLPCDVEANDNFLCFENYYYLHYCIPCTKTILDIAPIDVAIRKNDSFFYFLRNRLCPPNLTKLILNPGNI